MPTPAVVERDIAEAMSIIKKSDRPWVTKCAQRARTMLVNLRTSARQNGEAMPTNLVGLCDRAQAEWEADLAAVHSYWHPLKLRKLAVAPMDEFARDVFGIALHLDRRTWRLRNHFQPTNIQNGRA